ncbi:hypothetical protein AFERRI_30128 [Acidithiobacillus ferrivorans]|uniref:Uncharacterized protein n=1 Tax=Acidithiobacillus ferrivorans TaxID=160808 RepID=A0A060ULI1_9PROT|nr:hypothetical protein AFERRI_30128 [Acidithiobacillus ferrivorans]
MQTDPDATTQRDQFFPAQFFGEPGIPGEDDTEQALGIEAGTGQQAQFAEHGGIHFLGFVDEQHRAAAGGIQMGEPALAQCLEAAPAVTRFEGDGKDISQFPVKVSEIALWVMDGSDGQVRQLRQALGQQAQYHALAGAGIALDQGEAPFPDQGMLDPPAEVLDLWRDVDRINRQVRREGIPFEPVEGEQGLVHRVSSLGR